MIDRRFASAAAAALGLAACATAPVETSTTPAQPECAAYNATIYFEEGQVSLPAASTPILRETMDRIAACRAAGGALKRVDVVAHADRTAADAAAKADERARAQVVRQGLIEVGVPRAAIRINRNAPRETELMQRRATISVTLE